MDILRDMEQGIRISRTLSTSSSSTYDERQGSTETIVHIVRSEISKLNRHALDTSPSTVSCHPFYVQKRSSDGDQLRSLYPTAGLLSGRKRGLGLAREIVEIRRKLREVLLSWQGCKLRNVKIDDFSISKKSTRSLSKLMSDLDHILDSGCEDEEEEEEELEDERDAMSMWYESLHILARESLGKDNLESLALLVSAAGVNPIDAMKCPLHWQTELRAEADLERVLTSSSSEDEYADRWNTTVSYTKLALDLCALEILARNFSHIKIDDNISLNERIRAIVYLYDTNASDKDDSTFPCKSDKTPFVSALKFWTRQYNMCRDAEEIERIRLKHMNKELFVLPQCHSYREKMCLSLACTTSKEQIKRTVEIGRSYGLTELSVLVRVVYYFFAKSSGFSFFFFSLERLIHTLTGTPLDMAS